MTPAPIPLRYNLAAMVARFNETGRSRPAKRMEGDLSEYSVIQTKDALESAGSGGAASSEFIENLMNLKRWIPI